MLAFEPGSYRDRAGRVFTDRSGGVFRALSAVALGEWSALQITRFFPRATAHGRIVRTEQVMESPPILAQLSGKWSGVLQHERIPFVSYPYEWTFGMLRDAALLHLELLAEAIDENFTIKDGWSYNVQWRGTQPVFIDVGSFERMATEEPWTGYRQFCQTFLFPLMLQAYKYIPFQPWLRGRLEGISPQEFRKLLSLRDLFRSGVWSHVILHAWLDARHADDESNTSHELTAAGFNKELIRANVQGLARLIRRLSWEPATSVWSDYVECNGYSPADQDLKSQFVKTCVHTRRWKRVWDIGCNTGKFSRIAAENSDYVVALDADHLAVERLYQSLKSEPDRAGAPILPLVSNLADQADGLGWQGRERVGLKARGQPDLLLCLALVHHLAISHGIPLRELLRWLADLQSSLIIEFITPEDPMVQQLLRRRRDQLVDYDQTLFDQLLAEMFDVVAKQTLQSGTRTLYFAHPRST